MKRILFFTLAALLTLSVKAQSVDKKQKTITVSGSSVIKRELVTYKAKVTLNMDQAYYSNPECKTLDELKDMYLEKVRKNGLDTSKFKENKLEFMTYGYQKDGTVLSYESATKEDIETLSAIKMAGVTYAYSFKFEMTEAQRKTFLESALKEAEENAKRVCEASGQTIGEIISISETSPMLSIWKNYHQDYPEYTSVNVAYELK
ncbi:SIMPL domain-containing protein [uncultured Croceitalea sp.]|uniref:SIMPL domain-containing protein n=1 Tax=uncultured Croceitalea sp. TaxID=1798908 RepID=UPI0033061DAF